jgi:hypothetical protein
LWQQFFLVARKLYLVLHWFLLVMQGLRLSSRAYSKKWSYQVGRCDDAAVFEWSVSRGVRGFAGLSLLSEPHRVVGDGALLYVSAGGHSLYGEALSHAFLSSPMALESLVLRLRGLPFNHLALSSESVEFGSRAIKGDWYGFATVYRALATADSVGLVASLMRRTGSPAPRAELERLLALEFEAPKRLKFPAAA